MAFDVCAGLEGSPVRLEVLQPSGSVLEVRVEVVSPRRVRVACDETLEIGTAVQLDTAGRMLLGEVVALDRTPPGAVALLDIQHCLLKSGPLQLLPYPHQSGPPAAVLETARPEAGT
jgi:hypothetical protein